MTDITLRSGATTDTVATRLTVPPATTGVDKNVTTVLVASGLIVTFETAEVEQFLRVQVGIKTVSAALGGLLIFDGWFARVGDVVVGKVVGGRLILCGG